MTAIPLRRRLALGTLASALVLVAGAPTPAAGPRKPSPGIGQQRSRFDLPESALQDPTTLAIYVSNAGEQPRAKDGNGFVSRLGPDGDLREARFLPADGDPPLNGPKGLALIRDVLWVADLDRIVGYDLSSRRQVGEYDLTPFGVRYANEIGVAGSQRLFVSDAETDQVLAIDLGRQGRAGISVFIHGQTGGANALFVEPGTGDLLVAAGSPETHRQGRCWRVHTPPGATRPVVTPLPIADGQHDGIAELDGEIYTSDWSTGTISKLGKDGRETVVFRDIKGPADFAVTADGRSLIVTDPITGTVTVRPLP